MGALLVGASEWWPRDPVATVAERRAAGPCPQRQGGAGRSRDRRGRWPALLEGWPGPPRRRSTGPPAWPAASGCPTAPAPTDAASRPSGAPATATRPARSTPRHFTRQADAQRWLDEVTAALVTGQYVDPNAGRITFAASFEEWAARQVWESTTDLAIKLAARSVTFADVPLARLRRSHLDTWSR